MRRTSKLFLASFILLLLFPSLLIAKGKKKKHPYDVYNHEMHMGIFEAVPVACETCHADPESYGDRKKVNRMGCHLCHNSPTPILPATNQCTVCHSGGFPKPESHKVDWLAKHQSFAKQNPEMCTQCHSNQMFCIDCHKRRDTVSERAHRRNFKFFHSIEARANPHKCDACHTVNTCQECHSGKGTSLR